MLVKYPIMGLSYAHGYFAICGGGGSLKSGIKNTVVRCLWWLSLWRAVSKGFMTRRFSMCG